MKFIYDRDIIEVARELKRSALLHCCNCQNTFGSGIALAVKEAFPSVYEADCHAAKKGENKLGSFSAAVVEQGITVFNLYAQRYYGKDGKRYVNYGALAKSINDSIAVLEQVNKYTDSPTKNIVTYKLACGTAGGDWEIVKEILSTFIPRYYNLHIVVK